MRAMQPAVLEMKTEAERQDEEEPDSQRCSESSERRCSTAPFEAQAHYAATAELQEAIWDRHFMKKAMASSERDRDPREAWNKHRRLLGDIVEGKIMELVMGAIILFNVVIMIIEIDAAAACETGSICPPPDWCESANNVLLGVYTLDVLVKLGVYRLMFFRSKWNLLDLLIVAAGYSEFLMELFASNTQVLSQIRMLRVARIMRVTKLFKPIPELYKLIIGFVCTMRAIFWGFIMIMILLLMFAVLAVQLTQGMGEVVFGQDEEYWWCRDALSSVTKTTLFFFQTLVSGDSWGHCTIPLILDFPLLYVVFAGAYIIIQLGFTNLVLSVIVDAASDNREVNAQRALEVRRVKEAADMRSFYQVLCHMDADKSGTIAYSELLNGYNSSAEVQKSMTEVGMDIYDLTKIYRLMEGGDEDEVQYLEFVKTLMKCQTPDTKLDTILLSLEVKRLYKDLKLLMKEVHTKGERPAASPREAPQILEPRYHDEQTAEWNGMEWMHQCDEGQAPTASTEEYSKSHTLDSLPLAARADSLAAESSYLEQELCSIREMETQLRTQLDTICHSAQHQAAKLSRLAEHWHERNSGHTEQICRARLKDISVWVEEDLRGEMGAGRDIGNESGQAQVTKNGGDWCPVAPTTLAPATSVSHKENQVGSLSL
eukprot:TRINITY_DN47906_c0_g1_i1.p1 TRINITY_DN47906_c0_g1~~TRINITY_DN47906_c0_g1_i1.p1  ORF type:complete len:656 (-),score=111.42 TRINITY_DN47906_c0_g1_i1:52-2019(-)